MSEIRINTEEYPWWVEFENFVDLQKVVVRGNRDFVEYEKAAWFEEAVQYVSDMDCFGTEREDRRDYEYDWTKLTDEQINKMIMAYDECKRSDSSDFIMKIARILHPENKFALTTIRGYCQGDWQECIYVDDGTVDVDYVEALYFGKAADVLIKADEDDEYGDFITDDELWKLEREDRLKEELCKRYELKPEETKIYVSDGVVHSVKWKEVG